MKTKKGSTYESLLAVSVEQGDLYLSVRVPIELGDIRQDTINKMIDHIRERIATEKMPAATYEKCLESIDYNRELVAQWYTRLFQAYFRTIDNTPKKRQSPVEKERLRFLEDMAKKPKLFKVYASEYLSEEVMADIILPDDNEILIDKLMAVLRDSNGKED